ncbi:MAG: SDR family oxidoreductase [Anaerolineae bacterium]|nr:SDR family oxidoreductase [Anaerolineae bacterium]
MRLKGRVGLVTGGGSGIGAAIAQALAAEGIKVAIAGRRAERLAETVTVIKAAGGIALDIPADVSRESEITTLVEKVRAAFGPIDILVNNAGMHARHVPIHEHKTSTWDKTMALNLRTPFLLARAVIPTMRQRNYGHIVNISSIAGLHVYPESGAYTISKHALNALTELLQAENQAYNIHAHAVCPGLVDAPMANSLPTIKENMLTPEQIAELVRWLVTQPDNVKISNPILIDTMKNPWREPE